MPGLDGQAGQLDGLVGGDPAAHAQEDPSHGAVPAPALPAVAVLDLAGGDLLEGDLQVVLRARVDHRRRVLVEGALAEVVVVGVDLASALRCHDHARVVRIDALQKFVQPGLDQVLPSRSGRAFARPAGRGQMVATRSMSSRAARASSSLTTTWG